MKPVLMAVWMLVPCDSDQRTDLAARTTTVYVCEKTFGEAAGPFIAEGWVPPPAAVPKAEAPSKSKKKKKRKKRSRRV